jgi:hypothetical protein
MKIYLFYKTSGQPYPVDNFIQYFEQPGTGELKKKDKLM